MCLGVVGAGAGVCLRLVASTRVCVRMCVIVHECVCVIAIVYECVIVCVCGHIPDNGGFFLINGGPNLRVRVWGQGLGLGV